MPTTSNISLGNFEQSSDFYAEIELLITIKSFDLQAIRKRYLESRKRGKTGSTQRREPVKGGIASVKLCNNQLEAEVLGRMKEPRGIDFHATTGQLGIASENQVFVINRRGDKKLIESPWFSYIHTLEFNQRGDRLLISSSGFDIIQEYELANCEMTYEWLAWENGFAKGSMNGEQHILTRSAEEAAQLKEAGHKVILVDDPGKQPIPTAARAAFINSVTYDKDDLLATYFHEGAVYRIQRQGEAARVLEGMRNPHGGRPAFGGVMATSTGSGEVVLKLGNWEERFDFSKLPGKPSELEGHEWLQNSITYRNLIITIDSNRNAFVIFDPARGLYDMIPYNEDWAIQDMVACKDAPVQFKAISYIG